MSEHPRRPSDEAIPYIPRPEQTEPRGTPDMFLHMFRDLLEGHHDMPEQHMQRSDYTTVADEGNEVKKAREQALRRNKRNVAWFTTVTNGAEMVASVFPIDAESKLQIERLAESLRTSVDASQPTTDAMVSMGDTVCTLVIQALERLKGHDVSEKGAA